MATTIIPPPKPVHKDVTTEYLLKRVHDIYTHVMGDVDKAGDLMDHEYYCGEADAFSTVMILLTNPPIEEGKAAMEFVQTSGAVEVAEQVAGLVKPALPLIAKTDIRFLVGLALQFI